MAWSAPPLLDGVWHELGPDEAMPLMIRLCAESPAARAVCAQHDIAAVRMRALIAIRDGLLIEFLAAPHAGGAARIGAFVYRPGLFDLLDGASAVFHGIAGEGGLVVERAEQALEYAQLFCAGLQGDSGSFFPVPAGTALVQAEEGAALGRSLETLHRPATATPQGEDWIIDLPVAYGPMVFRSRLRLKPAGTLDMLHDRHLCGLAPLRVEGWEGGLRLQAEIAAEDAPTLPCTVCSAGAAAASDAAEDPDDDDVPF